MTEPKVIIVLLRRPNRSNPNEMRTDPLWEFGSFGCTGCHKRNLMNPKKIQLIAGTKLAFAQGGSDGFKLVHITPPIKIVSRGKVVEAKWSPISMPLKYITAPLLIRNDGKSDFPLIRSSIEAANCLSWEAKFASKFRSRRSPLDTCIAEEIIRIFQQYISTEKPDLLASTYIDALPYSPRKIDKNRQRTYLSLISKVLGSQ